MFEKLFKKRGKKVESESNLVIIINARLQPMHRFEFFEDSLEVFLK